MAPVAAGVSVIGTVASITDRNNQARKQRAAINAQIAAQYRAEQIRMQSLAYQAQRLDAQAQLEQLQNQFNAQSQQIQLQAATEQNKLQTTLNLDELSKAKFNNEIQSLAGQYENLRKNFQRQQESRSTQLDNLQQTEAGLQEVSNQNNQILDALRSGNIQLAGALAKQMSGETLSSKSTQAYKQSAQNQLDFQTAMQALQSGQATSEMLQNVLQTQEFAQILEDLGLAELAMDNSNTNLQQTLNQDNINNNVKMTDIQSLANRQNIQSLQDLLLLQNLVQANQTEINRRYGLLGLQSEGELNKSQTVSSVRQLEASKPNNVGLLSSLSAIGSSTLPLFSLLNTRQNALPSTIPDNSYLSTLDLNSPNRLSNYLG